MKFELSFVFSKIANLKNLKYTSFSKKFIKIQNFNLIGNLIFINNLAISCKKFILYITNSHIKS